MYLGTIVARYFHPTILRTDLLKVWFWMTTAVFRPRNDYGGGDLLNGNSQD